MIEAGYTPHDPSDTTANLALSLAMMVNRWERRANDPQRCSVDQLLSDIKTNLASLTQSNNRLNGVAV